MTVDVGSSGDCLQNTTEIFDEVVTINYPTDHTGRVRQPHIAVRDHAKYSDCGYMVAIRTAAARA